MKRARHGHRRNRSWGNAARTAEKRYADMQRKRGREDRSMVTMALRRTAAALAIATTVVGIAAPGALAQEYSGSTITIGGTTGVEAGDVLVLAPGVTISGGDVSNETGIGVIIGGGT